MEVLKMNNIKNRKIADGARPKPIVVVISDEDGCKEEEWRREGGRSIVIWHVVRKGVVVDDAGDAI